MKTLGVIFLVLLRMSIVFAQTGKPSTFSNALVTPIFPGYPSKFPRTSAPTYPQNSSQGIQAINYTTTSSTTIKGTGASTSLSTSVTPIPSTSATPTPTEATVTSVEPPSFYKPTTAPATMTMMTTAQREYNWPANYAAIALGTILCISYVVFTFVGLWMWRRLRKSHKTVGKLQDVESMDNSLSKATTSTHPYVNVMSSSATTAMPSGKEKRPQEALINEEGYTSLVVSPNDDDDQDDFDYELVESTINNSHGIPEKSDLKVHDSKVRDLQTPSPRNRDSRFHDQKTPDHKIADPTIGGPKINDRKIDYPKISHPKPRDPQIRDPKGCDLNICDRKVVDQKMRDQKTGYPKISHPKPRDLKIGNPKISDARIGDRKFHLPKICSKKCVGPKLRDPNNHNPKLDDTKINAPNPEVGADPKIPNLKNRKPKPRLPKIRHPSSPDPKNNDPDSLDPKNRDPNHLDPKIRALGKMVIQGGLRVNPNGIKPSVGRKQ